MKDFVAQYWPVLFWLCVGLPLVVVASRLAARGLRRLGRDHLAMVARRLVFYFGLIAIVLSILLSLEIDLTGVLATAGVLTIAIGFAAQTTLSNYISGLFLMGERSFRVGDLIRVGETTGTVESIDLLSVKLRTLTNTYVRLPNEALLKTQVVTITRFPIRRMDVIVRVAFETPLGEVCALLRQAAAANPHCLEEPEPLILVDDWAESGFNIRLGVWFEKSRYLLVRNALFEDVQKRFLEARIPFQLPRMTVEEYPSWSSKRAEGTD
jgi:small-conductance mechanosensitive channel